MIFNQERATCFTPGYSGATFYELSQNITMKPSQTPAMDLKLAMVKKLLRVANYLLTAAGACINDGLSSASQETAKVSRA